MSYLRQRPLWLTWQVTNRCNFECSFCNYWNEPFDIDAQLTPFQFGEVAAKLSRIGTMMVSLAGGEPLLRPEILEITQEYRDIIFLVFTNGTLIDEDMIGQFKKQKNVVPLLSLEGDAEDTDDRRGAGTYRRVLEIMGRLRKNGTFFGTSIALTRQNFTTVTAFDFIRDLADVGCKFFLFLDYTPTQEGTEDWVLLDDQRNQVMDLIKSYRKQFSALFIGVPWDEIDVGGCLSAGRGFVHVNAEGDVEPCPFAPIADKNLKDVSLKDALQSDFLKRIREIPELSKYTGGGCALWKNRERVLSLYQKEQ